MAAELANLADYNKPPVPRSQRRVSNSEACKQSSEIERQPKNAVKADRQSRNQEISSRIHHVANSRVNKGDGQSDKALRRKLQNELEQLQPWHEWAQELKRNPPSEDDDDEDDFTPRCHSRSYPPKQKGVQNLSWSDLPGEMRNQIYSHVVQNDSEIMPTLTHYPGGPPHRTMRGFNSASSENFPQSSWTFTQVSQAIRNELLPLLRSGRRVRTRMSTMNEYVATFHRPIDGRLHGWIKPFCCGLPLPARGVDILALVKEHHRKGPFHLEIDNPHWLAQRIQDTVLPRDADEMEVLKALSLSLEDRIDRNVLRAACIRGIFLKPIIRRNPPSSPKKVGNYWVYDRFAMCTLVMHLMIHQTATVGKTITELKTLVADIKAYLMDSRLWREQALRIEAKLTVTAQGDLMVQFHVDDNDDLSTTWFAPDGSRMANPFPPLIMDEH